MHISILAHKRLLVWWLAGIIFFFILSIFQDFLHARFHHYAYYWNESALFQTFWLFFLPGLWIQRALLQRAKPMHNVIAVTLPPIFHLIAYAFGVELISGIVLGHTYHAWQLLKYTFSADNLKWIIVYSLGPLWRYFQFQKAAKIKPQSPQSINFLDKIEVASGRLSLFVETAEISYFKASPPYVFVHTPQKKYLIKSTLATLQKQLNPDRFVRVHKSTIVQVGCVSAIESRLNGDFDLYLSEQTPVRMSRNYAADFKRAWSKYSPDDKNSSGDNISQNH